MKKQAINEVMKLQAEKRKKNKRRLKLIFAWVKIITILALIIGAIVFTALSPIFNIINIEVKGALYYNKEALINISGITPFENGFRKMSAKPLDLFRFRFGTAELALRNNCPYIRDVKVKYIVPSKVVIDVTERTAVFLVQFDRTSFLVDKEGYVLEMVTENGKSEYPVLKGLEFSDCKPGSRLGKDNIKAISDAMIILKAMEENDKVDKTNFLLIVDSIDTTDTDNIKLTLDSRITVNLGEMKHLNYRISATKTFFYKNIKKSEKGVLDFTSGERPIFSPKDRG